MNIQEAVKEAIKVDGEIHRKSARGKYADRFAAIKPTNSYETCLLMVYTQQKPQKSCRCWNPTADDLIADDWEVLRDPESYIAKEIKYQTALIHGISERLEKLEKKIEGQDNKRK